MTTHSLIGNVVSGAGGGIAATLAGRYNSVYGPGAGLAVAGLLSGNDALETLAGMSLASGLVGSMTRSPGEGGWY